MASHRDTLALNSLAGKLLWVAAVAAGSINCSEPAGQLGFSADGDDVVPTVTIHDASADPERVLVSIDMESYIIIDERSGGDLHVVGSGVRQFANGDIAVLDPAQGRIVVFDSAGRFLRHIERSGGGPGEWQRISGMEIVSDTIVLFAPRDRLIRLTQAGELISDVRFVRRVSNLPRRPEGSESLLEHQWIPTQPLANGGILVRMGSRSSTVGSEDFRRFEFLGIAYPGDELAVDTLGDFAGGLLRQITPDSVIAVMGGAYISVAAGRSHIYVGNGDLNVIIQFDSEGQPIRRFKLGRERLPIVRAARREFEKIGGRPAPRGTEWADSFAYFYDLLVDEFERLWIGQPGVDGFESQLWTVIDSTGRSVSDVTIQLPLAYRVLDVGDRIIIEVPPPLTLSPELFVLSAHIGK